MSNWPAWRGPQLSPFPQWPCSPGRGPFPPFPPFPPPFFPVVYPHTPRRLPSGESGKQIQYRPQKTTETEPPISEDQKWVNKWLKDRGKTEAEKNDDPIVKLDDAKQLLGQAFKLLDLLNQLKTEIAENVEMPDDEWEESVSQVASVKKSLESVESQLSDPTVLESLQRRRAKNRRKKAYLKRRRDREEAEEEREKAQWEEKHKEIDEWRAKRIATNIAKAREASVKLEAGETLSEVKLKQKDAQEMLEMLSTLKELRSIRREMARRKGKTQPAECDELFAKKISDLETFAKDLLLVYGQEEKTLRVMMEEEGEAVEQEQLRLVQETTQREQGSVIEEANSHEQPKTADPMKPFIDYYTQADWRLDSLIGIRHVWDSYVVPSDFPGSSRIPDGWVVPVQPSSKAWEAFLGADSEPK